MFKIICISGKAQNGKDTTAGYMKEAFEKMGKKVLIVHYADYLKNACKAYFGWNGEKDDYGRTLLQRVGTDVIRKQDPDFWVRNVAEFIKYFPDEWDYVIIPDARFPNEIHCLQSYGWDVTHVRVVRPNFESPLSIEQQKHPSETALDGIEPNCWMINNGTLDMLKRKCGLLVHSI